MTRDSDHLARFIFISFYVVDYSNPIAIMTDISHEQ